MTSARALPWTEVNAVASERVAQLLQLHPAREPRKYNCPVHGGSDSLHAYPGERGGFYCWGSCDQAYSNVDLAAAAWNVEPAVACGRLADAFGVQGDARPGDYRAAAKSDPAQVPDVDVVAYSDRISVYRALLELTELGGLGAEYLRTRGLEPDRHYGFRTIGGVEDWRELWYQLRRRFSRDVLHACGMDRPPWRGFAPVLVLPYWYRGSVIALRYRNLTPNAAKGDRYRNTTDNPPPVPFNACVLESLSPGDVAHVCEGEFDAFTLHQQNEFALGIPGVSATAALLRRTARALQPAGKVIAWYDSDAPDKRGQRAGEKGFERFCAALRDENGTVWLRQRVVRREVLGAKDVNELHLMGAL
jgi:hypothetical protein